MPCSAASVTIWSLREKSGDTAAFGCAAAHENTALTDSTPVRAMSAHCSSRTRAGARTTEPSQVTPKNP
jgi:hypothetical protein